MWTASHTPCVWSGHRIVHGAAIRELLQVTAGNILPHFSVMAMLELWLVGGAGILEHPAKPKDTQKVSIWSTAPLEFLRSLEGFELVLLHQGLFGSKSPKPTHMLVLNMPDFTSHLQANQLTTRVPSNSSIGLSADGTWSTTSLKEYAPALNRSMAHAFVAFIYRSPIAQWLAMPDSFWAKIAPMQASFGSALGMDYHR